MQLVQFEIPGIGRRVGVLERDAVHDVTSLRHDLRYLVEVFAAACRLDQPLESFVGSVIDSGRAATIEWDALWQSEGGGNAAAPLLSVGPSGSPSCPGERNRAEPSGKHAVARRNAPHAQCPSNTDRHPRDRFGSDVCPWPGRGQAGRRRAWRSAGMVLQRRWRHPAGPSPGPGNSLVCPRRGRRAGNRRVLRDRSAGPSAAAGVCTGQRVVGPCDRKDQLSAPGPVEVAALVPLARRSTRPRIFRKSRCAVRFAAAVAPSTTAAN